MITEQDLQAAIAECQGARNVNANTCIKLAAFYTIWDHLYGDKEEPVSKFPAYSLENKSESVNYESDSEFAELIHGMPSEKVWQIMDELMSTLQAVNRRLYDGVMRRLTDL